MGVRGFKRAAAASGGGESTNLGGPGDFTLSLAAGAYKMNNSHTTTLGGIDYSAGEHFINAGAEITSASLTGELAQTFFTPNVSDTDLARDVAYDGTTYIMVGNNSSAYYSTDKINWTVLSGLDGQAGMSLKSIMYADGVWLVGGYTENGQVWRSTDGVSWNNHTVVDTSKSTKFVFYFDGQYWCAGGNGGYGVHLSKSPDGISWTTIATPSTRVWGFYADDDVMAITLDDRKIYYVLANDGGHAQVTTSSDNALGICYSLSKTASGVFVITTNSGYATYSTSLTNTSWTKVRPIPSGTLEFGIGFRGKVWVLSTAGDFISTSDGATWTLEDDFQREYRGLTKLESTNELIALNSFNSTTNFILGDLPDSSLAIISTLGEVTQPNA